MDWRVFIAVLGLKLLQNNQSSVSARKFYLRAKVTPEDFFRGQLFRKGAKRY